MDIIFDILGIAVIFILLGILFFMIFVGYKVCTTPLWKMRENFERNTRRP